MVTKSSVVLSWTARMSLRGLSGRLSSGERRQPCRGARSRRLWRGRSGRRSVEHGHVDIIDCAGRGQRRRMPAIAPTRITRPVSTATPAVGPSHHGLQSPVQGLPAGSRGALARNSSALPRRGLPQSRGHSRIDFPESSRARGLARGFLVDAEAAACRPAAVMEKSIARQSKPNAARLATKSPERCGCAAVHAPGRAAAHAPARASRKSAGTGDDAIDVRRTPSGQLTSDY